MVLPPVSGLLYIIGIVVIVHSREILLVFEDSQQLGGSLCLAGLESLLNFQLGEASAHVFFAVSRRCTARHLLYLPNVNDSTACC